MAHGVHEGQMLDAGLLDPDDVVEEQFVAIRRGESGKRCPRSMDQNAPKLADLGMDSVGVGHDNLLQTMMAAMLRLAMMMTVRITRSGHMKRSHRSYGMRPMASAPMTTAKVGLMRFTMPFAD